MRRIPALLCVAGLAAAPASAAAGPSNVPSATTRSQTIDKFEWSTARGRLGVMVMGLTSELRKHFGAPGDRGVLVAHVEPGTTAARAGIEVGDVIVEVRGQKIDAAPDVLSALAAVGKGEHAKIELVRDGKSRVVDATLADNASTAIWSPLDEPAWFREWLKPFDQAKTDKDSNWIDELRELFAPINGPAGQHS